MIYSSSENNITSSMSSSAGVNADHCSLQFKSNNGADIELQVITHQPSLCQEFIITSPKFSFSRWLLYTAVLYAVACVLQLHVQVVICVILFLLVVTVGRLTRCIVVQVKVFNDEFGCY
jgi:hypothetical protein